MLRTASHPLVPLGPEEVYDLRSQFSNDADVKGLIEARQKENEGIREISQGQLKRVQGQGIQAHGRALKASGEAGLQRCSNEKKNLIVQLFCFTFGIKPETIIQMPVETIDILFSKYANPSISAEGDNFTLKSMKGVIDYIDEHKTEVRLLNFRKFDNVEDITSLAAYLSQSSCTIRGIAINPNISSEAKQSLAKAEEARKGFKVHLK